MERKVERGRRKHQVILIIWQRIVLHISTAVQATDRHYCGSCATRTSKCVAIHSCEFLLRIHEMVGLLAGATKSHCGYDQYKAGAGTKSSTEGCRCEGGWNAEMPAGQGQSVLGGEAWRKERGKDFLRQPAHRHVSVAQEHHFARPSSKRRR